MANENKEFDFRNLLESTTDLRHQVLEDENPGSSEPDADDQGESKVGKCQVNDCCYNQDGMCHALAITVGGTGDHPVCDTFCDQTVKGGGSPKAEVGACKVETCKYNQNLQCKISEIAVGSGKDKADCLTYEEKTEKKSPEEGGE